MKTTYENTTISTGISQIELRTVPTIPTGEDGYEPMRFSTNSTNSPPQALKEHGLISWKLAVLMVVIALAVSVISSVITGSIVYGKSKSDQDELKKIIRGSNWDPWSNWGACTVECGGGLRSRSRQCNDDVCVGNNQEVELCNTDTCRDGGWSSWREWSKCSVSCGGGIRSRDRLCSNPLPLPLGNYCPEHAYEVNACSSERCADHTVFFIVTKPSKTLAIGIPNFSRVVFNIGRGYNSTSGIFTCTISGLYHFFLSFAAYYRTPTATDTYCYIVTNTTFTSLGQFRPNNVIGYQTATAATYSNLHTGDTVYPYCYNWRNVNLDYSSHFTGALITSA